jgi:hypothetical protein
LNRRLALPRNLRNLTGVERGSTLVVSFIGSTDFRNPTVFADSGAQYDWGFTRDLHVSILVKPGVDCTHALREIYQASSLLHGYPQLVDVEQQHLACIVGADPLKLWPVRRGSEPWQQHFA